MGLGWKNRKDLTEGGKGGYFFYFARYRGLPALPGSLILVPPCPAEHVSTVGHVPHSFLTPALSGSALPCFTLLPCPPLSLPASHSCPALLYPSSASHSFSALLSRSCPALLYLPSSHSLCPPLSLPLRHTTALCFALPSPASHFCPAKP